MGKAQPESQPGPIATALKTLAGTVKTAFSRVGREPYVSYSVNGRKSKEEPVLEASLHAFYIGKIIRRDTASSIKNALLPGSSPGPIYDEDFIAGSLEYLFEHAKPGQTPRIVVCRVLSEIFNGPQDTKNALSTKEEIDLIYRIAEKKLGRKRNELQVEDLEASPSHAYLFEALRKAVDPLTGEFDADAAFGPSEEEKTAGVEDKPEKINCFNSLAVAKCLYRAAKEDERFAMRLKKGIPARLKKEGQEDLPTSYYSLTEIAVRIAELVGGKEIQGGIIRQAVYDDVIEALMKGVKGSFGDVAALQPLFEFLEGYRFETLHLDNDRNPYRQRRQRRHAWARLAAPLAIGLAGISVPVGIKQYEEARKKAAAEEMVREYISDQVRYVDYYIDGKYRVHADVKKIDSLTKAFLIELEPRYGIPEKAQSELRLGDLFRQFLVQDAHLLREACSEEKFFAFLMDSFIQKNRILLRSYGLTVDRPYAGLAKYEPFLLEAADKGLPELSVNIKAHTCAPQVVMDEDCQSNTKELMSLGVFYSHHLYQKGFELYLVEDKGRQNLVARDYWDEKILKEYPMTEAKYATAKNAVEAARAYVQTMKFYDIVHLMDWQRHFYDLDPEARNSIDHVDDSLEDQVEPYPYLIEASRLYNDHFGAFGYELIESSYHNPSDGTWKKCLKARIPGKDANFSIMRAREAAVHFHEAYWGKFY